MTRFLVVPQWQGSPAARAMLLVDGAEAIAGDLPRAACERIEVPIEAGESLDTGIRRFSALERVRDAVTTALAAADEHVVVVGGDCGVAVPVIAHAAAREPGLAVLWFDAHGDLNDPASSPSGAFAGMALRAVITDLGHPGTGSVPVERVVLAGARELDPGEQTVIDEKGLRTLTVAQIAEADLLAEAVAATGATAVHIHVDIDVLDPAAVSGVSLPVPFGLEVAQLTAAIAAVRARVPLRSASLSGFAPASPAAAIDDLGAILRVIGALA